MHRCATAHRGDSHRPILSLLTQESPMRKLFAVVLLALAIAGSIVAVVAVASLDARLRMACNTTDC
jgi:hypothetical protein